MLYKAYLNFSTKKFSLGSYLGTYNGYGFFSNVRYFLIHFLMCGTLTAFSCNI